MEFPARATAARLLLGLGLVVVFVYATVGFALDQSRDRYLANPELTRRNLAHSFASNLTASMDRVDVGLSSIAMQVEQDIADGAVNEAFLNAYVTRQKELVRD